jgi:hypothetical protein
VTDEAGRCGTCAAFTRVRVDPARGRVGECALEVYPPPVAAMSTCSRYRAKGAAPPPPAPRAAGEPRGRRAYGPPAGSASSGAARSPGALPVSRAAGAPTRAPRSFPKEIDIDMDMEDFRRVLRDVISEELGLGDAELGGRWQGGEMVLKPGKPGTAEKRIPLETFFHKVVMLRDRLRVLEAKLNSHPTLTDEDKVQLQGYITGCYGTLTTFNVLFAQREDGFSGSSSEG